MNLDQLRYALEQRCYAPGEFRGSNADALNGYWDKYGFLADGYLLKLVANQMCELLRVPLLFPTFIAGPELGGAILAGAMAAEYERQVLYIRDAKPQHGTKRLIEGPRTRQPQPAVILVDDVLTTGRSLVEAHRKLVEARANVISAGVVICRADHAELTKSLAPLGRNVYALFQARGHQLHPGGLVYDFFAHQ